MPRATSPVSLACVLTFLVTSCALWEEESEAPDYPATAISPDRIVHCEDEGDCGRPGAVRWSTPLEGEYHVYQGDRGEPASLLPVQDVITPGYTQPGAVVHEGTLHLHERDRFTAVDVETGEVLSRAEQVDPEQNVGTRDLLLSGDTLVYEAQEARERDLLLYLAPAEPGSLDWTHVEVEDAGSVAAHGHGRIALAAERDLDDAGPPYPHHLVDGESGEVVWSADLPGTPIQHAMTETHMMVRDRGPEGEGAPDLLYEVDLADGEVGEAVELPEERRHDRLAVTRSGPVVMYPDCRSDSENPCTRPVIGVDPDSGEPLWEHPRDSTVRTVVEDGDTDLLLIEDAEGRTWVEAATGEEVDTGDAAPELLAQAVTASMPWFEDDSAETDPVVASHELSLPGREEPVVVDQAAGAVHVLDHVGDDGTPVSVFLGCAPDGVAEASPAAPAQGLPCGSPRLFGVGLGT